MTDIQLQEMAYKNKRSFKGKGLAFLCCLAFATLICLATSAQKKYSANPGKPFMNDTVYRDVIISKAEYSRGWSVVSEMDDVSILEAGDSGIVYVVQHTAKTDLIYRFEHGALKGGPWTGMTDEEHWRVGKSFMDSHNNLYVVAETTTNNIFKVSPAGLTLLNPYDYNARITSYPSNVFFGSDDHIYLADAVSDGYGKYFLTVSYLKENGKWEVVRCGFPTLKESKFEMEVDKAGRIFIIAARGNNSEVSMYAEKQWTICGYITGHWGIINYTPAFKTDDGNLYVTGDKKLQKWNGKEWEEILFPDFYGIDAMQNRHDGIYYHGKGKDMWEDVLYRYEKGDWKELTTYRNYIGKDHPFYVNGAFYGIEKGHLVMPKERELLKVPIAARVKTYPIPVANKLWFNKAGAGYMKSERIFVYEGKLGVTDSAGNMILRPVFNKISVDTVPNAYYNGTPYAFVAENEYIKFKCPLNNDDPDYLSEPKQSTICSRCNGTGIMPDREETVEVKGEYVPEEKHTTSAPSTMDQKGVSNYSGNVVKGYKTETTTSGGYYKPSTTKTKTIAGGACPVCKGEKKVIYLQYIRYDEDLKKYVYVKN